MKRLYVRYLCIDASKLCRHESSENQYPRLVSSSTTTGSKSGE